MPKFILNGKVNAETDTFEISVNNAEELEVVCIQIIKENKSFFDDSCIVDKILIKLELS
ncbi:MAG: hypothetical protein ACTSP9_03060 [Promethearchaeota archaeon]